MMLSFHKTAALAILALGFGCQRAQPQQTSTVVAEVAGKPITLDELDQAIRGDLFRLRTESLHQLISLRLEQAAAKKRGIGVQELRQREIDAKVPMPSDPEIKAVFASATQAGNVPRDVTLADVRGQVVDYLLGPKRREAKDVYFDQLYRDFQVRLDLDALGRPQVSLRSGGPSVGPDEAPVTIIEYTDFNGKFASLGNQRIREIRELYPNEVRFLFRSKPEDGDPVGFAAAEASLCADDQHRYWDYRQAILAKQSALDEESLIAQASELKLDSQRFAECLQSRAHRADVDGDIKEARRFGLGGNPVYTVNGTPLSGVHDLRRFRRLIDVELGFSTTRRVDG